MTLLKPLIFQTLRHLSRGVVFHHDYARPHVVLAVRQKLLSKLKQFWKEGIMRLPERWKKVIEQNASYIT
ncbi:hypothetical protein WN51_11874 [Melipona quadrifasciata]|uniref:Histone-lysine N-methyltransferase SETMAR n=1 Tax=Melipona quadrifasciata TaxID=166423 RepID=A0A0M9A3S6_9HYME|nr:hypothetical protein WN51_11874 [Melipona quadrifasciata]